MSASTFWVILAFLVGALMLQQALLRLFHRRALATLQSEHEQILKAVHGEFEEMRKSLLQLQRDQVPLRESMRSAESAVRKAEHDALSARQALECQLDGNSHAHSAPQQDGFADTQILEQEAEQPSLLMH